MTPIRLLKKKGNYLLIDDLINPITDTMKAYTMDTSHTMLNDSLGNKTARAMEFSCIIASDNYLIMSDYLCDVYRMVKGKYILMKEQTPLKVARESNKQKKLASRKSNPNFNPSFLSNGVLS